MTSAVVFLLWVTVLACSCSAESRPHIVLIVADDLGYNDVSFHGSTQIPTPNIDRLAYSGIILNNYYVSPICTPTRSALMTGRHPIHTGMQSGVIVGDQPYGLPLTETLMPQYFQELGYRRHIVGKWHLGFFAKEYLPLMRGFESHFGYWLGAEDYFDHTAEAYMSQWGYDFRQNMDVLKGLDGNYSTELFTQEAVRLISRHNKSEPLLLYLPYQAVHRGNQDAFPLQAPKKFVDRHLNINNIKRRIYAGMVSALDDGVGEVFQALKDAGLYNNSIIVFTTDNGGPANGYDYNAASNFPLRGVKATLWEGGVRGVGFVHSPLLKKSGYVSQQMLHVTDWLPTLYRAAGGNPKRLKNQDGYDSWEMLSTNGSAVRTEMLHNIDPINNCSAIRVGDYKLLLGNVGGKWNGWYPPWQLESDDLVFHVDNYTSKGFSSVHEERYPSSESHQAVVIKCGHKPSNASTNCNPVESPCLYHIPTDPCEYNNIASQRKDIVVLMLTHLHKYSQTMVPPANKNFDDRGNPDHHDGIWQPWITL